MCRNKSLKVNIDFFFHKSNLGQNSTGIFRGKCNRDSINQGIGLKPNSL